MGRSLKPLPKDAPTTPKKNVAKILARREVVLQLMLAGASVQQIRAHLKKDYDVGLDTVEDDMRAMTAEVVQHFKEKLGSEIAMTAAQFDRIAMEQLQVAQAASRDGDKDMRLQALRDERSTRKQKLELMGLTSEKVELTGVMAHAVATVEPEQMAAFIAALSRSGISPKDAAKMIEA